MADWAEQRAALLLIGPAKAGPVRQIGDSPCGTFWTDFLTNTIAAELRAERALAAEAVRAERERLRARLREPDDDLLARTVALLQVQPEPDGGALECVALVLVCTAAALEADHTRTEGE